MRVALEMFVGANAVAGVVATTLRLLRSSRRRSSAETTRELEERNREWDELNNRMTERKP